MILHTHILNPNHLNGDEAIGGKARNLLTLNQLGFNIPKWTVISASIFVEQLSTDVDEPNIHAHLDKLQVSTNLLEELLGYFGHSDKRYAVRSSYSNQDGGSFSFAGKFDTFLGVEMEDIPTAVKELWRSIASEHVLFYRKKNNLPLNWEMSVIVQEMIAPTVSGAAFGIDPVKEDIDTSVISAVYGLGKGLASGELRADVFSVKEEESISVIATKEERLIEGRNGFLIKEVVPDFLQKKPCLNETQIKEIVVVLDRLQVHYGHPQDIEYAYVEDQFYLLQTRSIATH